MDLSKLATLKKKLIEGTDFGQIYTYFLDHFGENPEFFDEGELTRHPMVEAALNELSRQMGNGPLDLDRLRLVWLAEHQFLHGSGSFGNTIISVIYFEEIHKGLAALAKFPSRGRTDFMRFTAQPLPKDWSPSLN
jgi:hypothetical protein